MHLNYPDEYCIEHGRPRELCGECARQYGTARYHEPESMPDDMRGVAQTVIQLHQLGMVKEAQSLMEAAEEYHRNSRELGYNDIDSKFTGVSETYIPMERKKPRPPPLRTSNNKQERGNQLNKNETKGHDKNYGGQTANDVIPAFVVVFILVALVALGVWSYMNQPEKIDPVAELIVPCDPLPVE